MSDSAITSSPPEEKPPVQECLRDVNSKLDVLEMADDYTAASLIVSAIYQRMCLLYTFSAERNDSENIFKTRQRTITAFKAFMRTFETAWIQSSDSALDETETDVLHMIQSVERDTRSALALIKLRSKPAA